MKRFFISLLALCILFAGGCSSLEPLTKSQETVTLGETEEKKTEEAFVYPTVLNPLTQEKINAIPVAKEG